MAEDWSYAVLGTGALGGLYGGLLARAGRSVHFLLRSDLKHVREHGLQVDTPLGDFQLASPHVYGSAGDMPPVDVVLVTWKTTSNASLREALRGVCHPDTIVLVLQNGWDVEQLAAEVVGKERVLGGCCFLCSNKIGPGHIRHLDYGRITFGEYSSEFHGQITPRMKTLTAQFRQAQIDIQPTDDLRSARWRKLVWNIPFNGLSVVLGADTQQIVDHPESCALARALMQEVSQSALAVGCDLPEEHIERMLADTRQMVPYDSSMLLDYRARRPMEVEAIFGNPLRAAQAAGYRPAQVEMLTQQLRFLDQQNRRPAP